MPCLPAKTVICFTEASTTDLTVNWAVAGDILAPTRHLDLQATATHKLLLAQGNQESMYVALAVATAKNTVFWAKTQAKIKMYTYRMAKTPTKPPKKRPDDTSPQRASLDKTVPLSTRVKSRLALAGKVATKRYKKVGIDHNTEATKSSMLSHAPRKVPNNPLGTCVQRFAGS